MNDPGFDHAISDDARAVESRTEADQRDQTEEDEQAFLAPS
jgi:hypothetical protein